MTVQIRVPCTNYTYPHTTKAQANNPFLSWEAHELCADIDQEEQERILAGNLLASQNQSNVMSVVTFLVSKNYKRLLDDVQAIQDDHNLKDYHAFVFWYIQTNYGLEAKEIMDSFCDGCRDKGIDAVLINKEETSVTVFQSKFEREGNQVLIKDSEIKLLALVKSYFKSRGALAAGTAKANHATRRLANEAYAVLHGPNPYSLELVFLSTHKKAPQTDDLVQKTLGFRASDFQVLDYSRIMGLVEDKARDFTPNLGNYPLAYIDSDGALVRKHGTKAWVLTARADDIRRMVTEYGDNLFKKNVRGFLDKNVCNDAILSTLKNKPDNFWYYNNGICILCDDADLVVERKYIRIINPQIVNGCQTAKSIEKFQGDLESNVLVRVVASNNHRFIDEITHYQNSSNPVKKRDFKSNDPIQIRLKRDLKRRGYYYEVKRGLEFRKLRTKYRSLNTLYPRKEISNEDVAKLLVAVSKDPKMGPALATSKGSETFFDDEFYPKIFREDMSPFSVLAPYLLSLDIYWTYARDKRFFVFDQAWKFKSRAAYYVLRFIYDALSGMDWEKQFVELNDDSDDQYRKRFFRKLKKIVDSYFLICYKSWRKANRLNHVEYNAYIQSPETLKQLRKKHRAQLTRLARQVRTLCYEI